MPRPKWGRKAASGLLIAAMILSMIITTPVFAEGAAPNHISAVMTESPQDSVMIAWETSDTTVTQTVVEVVKAADEAQFDSAEVMTYSDGSISIAGQEHTARFWLQALRRARNTTTDAGMIQAPAGARSDVSLPRRTPGKPLPSFICPTCR